MGQKIGQTTTDSQKTVSPKDSVQEMHSATYFTVFLQKKLEKVASALHLVTNLMAEHEPLRMTLRSTSLNLLSLSFSSQGQLALVQSGIKELTTLLSVAKNTQVISEMNYTVLDRELRGVLEQCESYGGGGGMMLSQDLLTVSHSELAPSLPRPVSRKEEADVKDDSETVLADMKKKEGEIVKEMKKTEESTYQKEVSDTGSEKNEKDTTHSGGGINGKKKARREQIIDIVKDKGEVNIKDISFEIGDVSDKTIQRDLNLLIRKGVVEKHGKRRWTTYTLNPEHAS